MVTRTFLFWNMGGLPRIDRLQRLVERHAVDTIVLAETAASAAELESALRSGSRRKFREVRTPPSRIAMLSRTGQRSLKHVFVDVSRRFVIFRMRERMFECLIACAHLPSKLHRTDADLAMSSLPLVDEIVGTEERFGHRRTIVVGDLNMNPFEDGMIAARGLHAVPTMHIALEKSRIVDSREYPYFYNPMWRFFGDECPGPPGTYFRRPTGHVGHFWNIFDQVLVRPDLLEMFEGPTILESDGEQSLAMRDGRPDAAAGSAIFRCCSESTFLSKR